MASAHIRSVGELVAILASAADRPTTRRDSRVDLLTHCLQAADEAYLERPADEELHVAALVHDLGHLLPDEASSGPILLDRPQLAGRWVMELLGERVAVLVSLHVEAKRYLAATDRDYVGALSAEGRRILILAGGPLSGIEAERFERTPYSLDALVLGRVDELAHDPRRTVPRLDAWLPAIEAVSARAQRDRERDEPARRARIA